MKKFKSKKDIEMENHEVKYRKVKIIAKDLNDTTSRTISIIDVETGKEIERVVGVYLDINAEKETTCYIAILKHEMAIVESVEVGALSVE